MIKRIFSLRLLCLFGLLLGLAACEDSEDRAARHLENAEALVADGDPGAAVLEFRNVLEFVPNHREALSQLAALQLASGTENAAFATYQRLVENHPESSEGWLAMGEISIRNNQWDSAATYAERAEALVPDDTRTALILAALRFRQAVEDENSDLADDAASVARRHVEDDPTSLIARQILIAHAGTFRTLEDALAETNAALDVQQSIYALHQIKVQTLAELQRIDDVGPALEAMALQFPDLTEPRQLLVTWYMQREDPAAVERFLRERAAADEAPLSDRLNLINFLREIEGLDATLAEISQQIAAVPAEAVSDIAVLRGLRATLEFDRGFVDAALAELEDVLTTIPDGADANNLRVARARILQSTGRESEAQTDIETVLEQDSGHVEAIKIKAARLIVSDETDEAVRLLRQAQATAPRDPEVVLMMGEAHARAGNWELATDRYAAAVDLAERAPRESLAYANFLLSRQRPGPAETVLVDALRQAPAAGEIMEALTRLHLQENRLPAARRGIAELRQLDSKAALRTADVLEVELLRRESRSGDMQTLVEDMVADGRGNAATLASLIQTQITEGNLDAAKEMLTRQLEAFPGDPLLRFLQAGLFLVEGETGNAEPIYREILAEAPGAAPPLRVLHGLLMQQGREDEALDLLEQVNAAAPDAFLPRLLLAEQAERAGDVERAIGFYEDIYADDSTNLVVANNLANLLMVREDDAAAIERAVIITRRLRDTEEPAFQDTYGRLAYLRGDYETALEYLVPAAEALPEEPIVQYHLAMAYLAADRSEEARAALERTLGLAENSNSVIAQRARTALDGM